MKQYIRLERSTFMIGMIYLVIGLSIDLAVPIYIGLVTDDIATNGSKNLLSYTIYVSLIVGVS